ncbi:MAG: hypothetical protein ACE363_11885 [Alphaproteobacteria bacterium]
MSQKLVLITLGSALMLGGCETLESINPFGGNKKAEAAREEKFDDRPLTEETGQIPPDTGNRRYTDEDLRPD